MPKVLHLYKNYFPESYGGLEQAIFQISLATSKLDVKNRIVTLSEEKDIFSVNRVEGEVHYFPRSFQIASCDFSFKIMKGINEHVEWADILHYHFPWPQADILHLFSGRSKPAIITYHSDIVRQQYLALFYRPLELFFLHSVSKVVATSENYLKSSKVLQKHKSKACVIPLGIDPGTYPKKSFELINKWRQRLGEGFFLFVGVLRYYKGLHILLKAASNISVQVVIVGAGPIESELRKIAEERVLNNIIFLGFQQDEDKMALYHLCKAVVFPSHLRSEAFGITLLEAAMSSKPMISSEINTGTSFVNRHNKTGLVVPPGDHLALRKAMLKLQNDPDLCVRLGSGANRWFYENFTGQKQGRSYYNLYNDLLHNDKIKYPRSSKCCRDSITLNCKGSIELPKKSSLQPDEIRSIAIISNQAFSMINFRGKMIEDMVSRGINVYALAPDFDDRYRTIIESLGAEPVDFSLDRTGMNPANDFRGLLSLITVLKHLKPDAVFCNFIKPVIYGSIAAKRTGIKKIFSMISGLGYVFTSSPEKNILGIPILKKFVRILYKLALSYNKKVFFHNPDDLAEFVDSKIVGKDKAVRVYGSGVDLSHFKEIRCGHKSVGNFTLSARLLFEKGIREFIMSAKIIKKKHPGIRFVLLGGLDVNPTGFKGQELEKWVDSGVIEWPGQVQDVRPWLRKASVFVLPSWREGTPRSTLEAMACGKAIITTDVPGCRETVFPYPETGKFTYLEGGKLKAGINGIMVPVRDPNALAQAMEYMINNPDKVVEMGRQSRLMAEKYYDVHKVNRVIFKEMGI